MTNPDFILDHYMISQPMVASPSLIQNHLLTNLEANIASNLASQYLVKAAKDRLFHNCQREVPVNVISQSRPPDKPFPIINAVVLPPTLLPSRMPAIETPSSIATLPTFPSNQPTGSLVSTLPSTSFQGNQVQNQTPSEFSIGSLCSLSRNPPVFSQNTLHGSYWYQWVIKHHSFIHFSQIDEMSLEDRCPEVGGKSVVTAQMLAQCYYTDKYLKSL